MKFLSHVIEMLKVTIWGSPFAINEISRQKLLVTNKKLGNFENSENLNTACYSTEAIFTLFPKLWIILSEKYKKLTSLIKEEERKNVSVRFIHSILCKLLQLNLGA